MTEKIFKWRWILGGVLIFLCTIFEIHGSSIGTLVYAFAIAWFSSFLGFLGASFYSNGIIPMFVIFEIFGAYRLYKFIKVS